MHDPKLANAIANAGTKAKEKVEEVLKKEELPKATPEQTAMARKVVDNLLVFFSYDFPWAAQVYYLMEKEPKLGMGTMGVSVQRDRIRLQYDPLFVLRLERAEVGFVMVHEAFHVLFHHCTKRIPQDNSVHHIWNIAADMAINCLITRSSTCQMPVWHEDPPANAKSGGKPARKGDPIGVLPAAFKQEDKKSMEYYYSKLPIDRNGGGGGGSGQSEEQQTSLDTHDGWGESDIADAAIRDTVERIDRNRQWGNMPGEAVSAIMAAQQTEVPWWKILRHMLGDMMSKVKIKTSKKVNRRMPVYPWKGDIKTGVDKKLVAFDTSGSVGDDELEKFLAEVNRLVEDEQPVDTICFDTRVINQKPIPFTRSRSRYKFLGRGGTSFTPVVEFAKAHNYKHLIILTDGGAEQPPHIMGLDILWVLTPDGIDKLPDGWQGRYMKMKKLKDRAFR